MSRFELRKEVTGRKSVSYTKRHALYASKCDCCGKVFLMLDSHGNALGDQGRVELTFSESMKAAGGFNFASFNVCSMHCAAGVSEGGWRNVKGWKKAPRRVKVVNVKVEITPYVLDEAEIVRQWEARPEEEPAMSVYVVGNGEYYQYPED